MEVRPLEADEVAEVAEAMGRHPVLVADRLGRQKRGEAVSLVAWQNGRPVGQALLHWRRPVVGAVPTHLHGLPYLEDVYVPHDMRNLGIGTRLLEAAESLVRERGMDRVTLAVNIDNQGARRLYARLGYGAAGAPSHNQPFWHYTSGGGLHSHDENVLDLIKDLGPVAPAPTVDGSPDLRRCD